MAWGIGYIICTALASVVAVRVMRYQGSRGGGTISVFMVGILAGGLTAACALALMVIIATSGSQIEKIEPPAVKAQPTVQ